MRAAEPTGSVQTVHQIEFTGMNESEISEALRVLQET
jgi:hypothetical protein